MHAAEMSLPLHTRSDSAWSLQQKQQLETELHSLKDQLQTASLNNANQLLIIAQIYNIASLAQQPSAELSEIKALISKNVRNLNFAMPARAKSHSSQQGDGHITPPITGPDSPVSEDGAARDDASTQAKTAAIADQGGVHGRSKGSAKAINSSDSFPVRLVVREADLLGIDSTSSKKDAGTVAEVEMKGEEPKVRGQDKAKTSGPAQEGQAKASRTTATGHTGAIQATGPARATEDDEEADEMWQEFTLEEELEGIADAAPKDRAALRAALRVKEDAHRHMLRQAAREKRLAAEKEGMRLRQLLSKAKQEDETEKQQQSQNSNNNDRDKSAITTAATTTTKETAPASTGIASRPAARPHARPAAGAPGGTPAVKPRPVASDDDTHGTTKSTIIICVEPDSPKSSSRFGVVFDPSHLDAITAAKISGTAESKDARRSILIQNIPPEFTMHKLLAHVRGGTVVSVHLVSDTLSSKNHRGDLVAMVTFKTAREASISKDATAKIMAHSEISDTPHGGSAARLQVSLLPTPTYPSRDVVAVNGSSTSGLTIIEEKTRCLVVHGFPKCHIKDLCTELLLGMRQFPSKMHVLEEMWFAGDTLHIHYTSIQEAVNAHRIISFFHFGKYNAVVHFAHDPCADLGLDLDGIFHNGSAKLASHGHMGLKSLLETVGLVTYARSHDKETTKAQKEKDVIGTLTVAGATIEKEASDAFLIDVSIDGHDSSKSKGGAGTPTPNASSAATVSAPWTDDLMVGLDKL